jgi:hypothetical protein
MKDKAMVFRFVLFFALMKYTKTKRATADNSVAHPLRIGIPLAMANDWFTTGTSSVIFLASLFCLRDTGYALIL